MVNLPVLYKTPEGEQVVRAIYDTALSHWPIAYEAQNVLTRYGEAFVIACGEVHAPALILLHGAGGNSAMWAGDVVEYSRQYRVYAVDLPGEAGRSAAIRPAWDSPAFGEWLEDVFDGLHVQQAAVVGISQGAWTAVKFAVRHPERVTKLVLIAPGGIVADRPSFLIRAIALMALGKWGIKRMVAALFGDQPVSDEVVDTVVAMTAHFKPRIGVLPIFSDDELRHLTMPTLLLGGTKDIIRDMGKIEARMRGLLPQLTVNIIAGAGHAVVNTGGCVMEFLTR